jgi:hypothetical protein
MLYQKKHKTAITGATAAKGDDAGVAHPARK